MEQQLNKTAGDFWWDKLLAEGVDARLFDGKSLTASEQRALFKQHVCIVNIETSSYCNRKCDYCPDSIYDRSSQNLMDDQVFDRILDNLAEIGYHSTISLNLYNEPLADDHLFGRIRQVRERLPEAFIKFNSNGDYIKPAVLDALVEAGNNAVFITLHPRPGKAYSDADRMVHFQKFFKRIGLPLEIDGVEAGKSIRADRDYRGMRLKVMADNWGDYGNSRGSVIEFLNKREIRNSPCLRPFREMTIYHDGQVYPCCQFFPDSDPQNLNQVGTIQSSGSLFELYSSRLMSGYRQHLFDFGPKMSPCDTCADPDNARPETAAQRSAILAAPATVHADSLSPS